MSSFLVRRVLSGLLTLFIFVTLMFFLADIIVPGDFTTQFALGMNAEQHAAMRHELGLDRPVMVRYLEFIAGLPRGDFGASFWGYTVGDALKAVLPRTLLIFTFSMAIAFPVGHWLGKIAGWRSGEKGAAGLTIASVGTYTIFPPLLVFVLVIGVSWFTDNQGIGYLRAMARDPGLPSDVAWMMLWSIAGIALVLAVISFVLGRQGRSMPGWVWAAAMVAGPVLVWLGMGWWEDASNIIVYLALPIVAVTVLAVGEVVLVSKSTTAEAASEDFVFTARAKGLPDREVRDHHAARYALLPTLSKLMVSVPFILVGLMIVEMAFTWPKDGAFGYDLEGLSMQLFTSLEARDTNLVVGGLLAVGLVVFGLRLLLDVLHAVLDPRIRTGFNRT